MSERDESAGPRARETPTSIRVGKTGGKIVSKRSASALARDTGQGRTPPAASERLERLVVLIGNNQLASLMGVSRSQPSRWRSGAEGMSPENHRRMIDLDYVFGRLEQLFTPRQAEVWLTSENAHLGARPIDVLLIRGVAPVIAALDAEAEGAFA